MTTRRRSARLNDVARQRNVPIWTNTFKFYGPEEVVRAQWAYTKRRLGSITNSRFVDGAFYRMPLTDEQTRTLRDEQDLGVPESGSLLNRRTNGAESDADHGPSRLLAGDSDDRRGRDRIAARVLARAAGSRT